MTTKSGADYNRDEELWARRNGATLVKNSGRGERKGDARYGELLIDCKFTEAGSYSLNLKKHREFEKQAFTEGLVPVTIAVFGDGSEIAMIAWDDLKTFFEDAQRYYDLCR